MKHNLKNFEDKKRDGEQSNDEKPQNGKKFKCQNSGGLGEYLKVLQVQAHEANVGATRKKISDYFLTVTLVLPLL